METKFILLVLNGLTLASILFVLGSGLTLAFGLMRVVNLAHGAFYMLGGYIGWSVVKATDNWLIALVVGGLSIAIVGFIFERFMLTRVRGGDLPETLLTVALAMIIADLSLVFWPRNPVTLNVPKYLNPSIEFFGITYPGFRFVMMLVSILIAAFLGYLIYKTKLGAAVRTGVDDRETVDASTLLRSIMRLTPPRSGTITWKRKDLVGMEPFKIARTGIGYVPQGRRLFPSLSVEEHLTLTYRKVDSADSWTPERVFDFFPELADRRKVSGTKLSGGEQQMLAIGRALVTNPDIILLDEPSEGLSPVAIDRVIEICRKLLMVDISILLVEQNIHVAEALAQQIYIMLGGRTVYESEAQEFLENTELRQKYLGI